MSVEVSKNVIVKDITTGWCLLSFLQPVLRTLADARPDEVGVTIVPHNVRQ